MSDSQKAHPAAEMPEIDPEIEALLKFEPAPRKRVVEGAWTPELQREFIARLAITGSPGRASEEMGKTDTGVRKLYRSPAATSFRAAWDKAVELAERRKAVRAVKEQTVVPGSRPPSLDHRRKATPAPCPQCGREHLSAEDEAAAAYAREVEEARARVFKRIDRIRRGYLREIRDDAEKRHAFEVLNGPIDWDNIQSYSVFGESAGRDDGDAA